MKPTAETHTCSNCGELWEGYRSYMDELRQQDHKGPLYFSQCCDQSDWRAKPVARDPILRAFGRFAVR